LRKSESTSIEAANLHRRHKKGIESCRICDGWRSRGSERNPAE
jgi:hypothetical protein